MCDDRVQKSKDHIDAWTARQVESGDQAVAAQAQEGPVDIPMEAPREDGGPVDLAPVAGDARVETVWRTPRALWLVIGRDSDSRSSPSYGEQPR